MNAVDKIRRGASVDLLKRSLKFKSYSTNLIKRVSIISFHFIMSDEITGESVKWPSTLSKPKRVLNYPGVTSGDESSSSFNHSSPR